jgi:phenylalanyl-tRNA synthetase alpha chain
LSDTFYIEGDVLLRTQTSTVQIRTMETHKPPIAFIAPGRCYRNDNDASHSPVFSQMEALVVDKGVTFADFRDMIAIFVKHLLATASRAASVRTSSRSPMPSAELDILCSACKGAGCPVCKGSGWLELGGAGMVDPPCSATAASTRKFTPAMRSGLVWRRGHAAVRHPHMRMLFENDVRMLRQFRV